MDLATRLRRQLEMGRRFRGRASRVDFWRFLLLVGVSLAVAATVDALVFPTLGVWLIGPLSTLVAIALLLPSLAISARRLHDIGRSGSWLFIALIPGIGLLLLIWWFLLESEPRTNRYGRDPLDIA